MPLQFKLYAVGVSAPGVGSLQDLHDLRRGAPVNEDRAMVLPAPQALPANERRRASQAVRLTLACAEQALRDSPFAVDTLRTVFASDEGTGEVCQQMLEALATKRAVSPLLFHNSVHNAPSGYFSIAYQNQQSATSISLGQQSFASGLLCAASEACTSRQPVLLLAYDPAMTGPMLSLLPVTQPTACAWIIDAGDTPGALASFALSLHAAGATSVDPPLPEWMPADWASNSSAQAMLALGLLDDAREQRACELQLGAQILRIERLGEGAAC